jgi:hypothetical protein
MKMTLSIKSKSLLMPLLVILVSCAGHAAQPELNDGDDLVPPTSRSFKDMSCNEGPLPSRADRLEILSAVVKETDEAISKNQTWLSDEITRERVGTFSAGTLPDTVPFVSLERRCWADFYEAQLKLAAEDEAGAKVKADHWMRCLSANFPERVSIAAPYAACFVKPAMKKSASKKAKSDSPSKSKTK